MQLAIKIRKTFYFVVVKERMWKQSPFTKLAEILPKLTLGAVRRVLGTRGRVVCQEGSWESVQRKRGAGGHVRCL